MPVTLPAFAAYVGAGGVAVWAAGNGDNHHPAVEGMAALRLDLDAASRRCR